MARDRDTRRPDKAGPEIVAAGGSDVGAVRKLNEDAFVDRTEDGLWAVTDGMGGHDAGDVASKAVAQALQGLRLASDPQRRIGQLREAMDEVNQRLREIAQKRGGGIVGATVSIALSDGRNLAVLWAGDSRVYVVRGGVALQVTEDHGPPPGRGGAGHVVTRAVGAEDTLRLDLRTGTLEPGDHLVLCSDGLTDVVSPDEIADLAVAGAVEDAPRRLIERALSRGAPDNVTAVVVGFGARRTAARAEAKAQPHPAGVIARRRRRSGGRIAAALAATFAVLLAAGAVAVLIVKPEPIASWIGLVEPPPVVVEAGPRIDPSILLVPTDQYPNITGQGLAAGAAYMSATVRLRALVMATREGLAGSNIDLARFSSGSDDPLDGIDPSMIVTPPGIPPAFGLFAPSEDTFDAARLARVLDSLPLVPPVREGYRFSSAFGFRLHPVLRQYLRHAGLDLAAPTGTPVYAPGVGSVVSAGVAGGYGNLVILDHGHGITTRYAHLDSMAVTAGQIVDNGTLIGQVGTTGRSTGPHLHWEVRLDGEPVDPLPLLLTGEKILGFVRVLSAAGSAG